MDLLRLRAFSLCRRASSLPEEMNEWYRITSTKKEFEKNSSQLGAIKVFMDQSKSRLAKALTELDNLSRSCPLDKDTLLEQALFTESEITRANYIWDFFRTKLEQRLFPGHANMLFQTDLIAYSCYDGIFPQIDILSIDQKLRLRDYPLTYLISRNKLIASPITWPRSSQIEEIDGELLPIPVIGIPTDHIRNPWELLFLHHEASHDIDEDLNKPSKELGPHIFSNLFTNGVPQQRAMLWKNWTSEIFADFLGIFLAGPSFISFLANYLTLPARITCQFPSDNKYPANYLRILLGDQFLRVILPGGSKEIEASGIIDAWNDLYKNFSENAQDFLNDFGIVIDTILNTKLQALIDKNGEKHSLREIAKLSESDYKLQIKARNLLMSGENITFKIPIRHLVASAYMASEQLIVLEDIKLEKELPNQLRESIIKQAPKGSLGVRSGESKKYLRDLANMFFESKTGRLVQND